MKISLFLLFIFCSFNLLPIQGQETNNEVEEFLLRYNYTPEKNYKYQKTTNSKTEEHYTLLSIQVQPSINENDFFCQFSLDSCSYSWNNKPPKNPLSEEKLEQAKIQVLYTKTGREINRIIIFSKKYDFYTYSDYSDDDRLFELPDHTIKIGDTWITNKVDNNGLYELKEKKMQNKFMGIELKNEYECYLINFSGETKNTYKHGDYTQIDYGLINGSLWFDVEDGIMIAIESETKITKSQSKHPGYKGPALPSAIPLLSKTTVELIEIESLQ